MDDERHLSSDDIELFRSSVGPVQRLRQDRVHARARRPQPLPRQTLEEARQVLHDAVAGQPGFEELETGDELWFVRPGTQHRLLRKLRRGHFSIGAELDLHGMTVAEARETLTGFLKECHRRGVRAVRIVHGKGRRSPHGRPVLKGKLDRWLRLREDVVAFASARAVDGGTGAVYVLLKSR